MMLTRIDVVTAQGTTLALPLQDSSAGFLVKNVDGLDPVKTTIVRSKFAQLDGTNRQSSSREDRNILMTLGFTPNYSTNDIRSLRNYLYGYLMPKSVVTLKFYVDGVLFVQVLGEVESCETPLFSKEPEVVISLICFDPDFSAPSSVVVPGNTVSTTTEQVLSYPGSSATGMKFKLSINRTLTGFALYNRLPSGITYAMDVVGAFAAGDVLDISTINRAKGAWLTRAGSKTPVLYVVSPTSPWVNLFPGVNNIRVAASGAAIPFTIEYLAKYGGL